MKYETGTFVVLLRAGVRHPALVLLLTGSAWAKAAAEPAPAPLPQSVFAGAVVRIERVSGPIPWQDLSRILTRGDFSFVTPPDPALTVQRPPAADHVYAVVHVRVNPGHTLGKYDYALQAEGRRYACLALAWGSLPYDARNWIAEADPNPLEVRLLFEIPAAARQATLTFELPVTLPQDPTPLAVPAAAVDTAAPDPATPSDNQEQQTPQPAAPPAGTAEPAPGSEWL